MTVWRPSVRHTLLRKYLRTRVPLFFPDPPVPAAFAGGLDVAAILAHGLPVVAVVIRGVPGFSTGMGGNPPVASLDRLGRVWGKPS